MNLIKKAIILGSLVFLNLVYQAKADTIGLEFGASFNLSPHISLYYRPLENPYNLDYEIKYTSYYAIGGANYVNPAYSLGFGVKKYFDTNFANLAFLIFIYDDSKYNKNAIQLGGEVGAGKDFFWSNTINGSSRLSLGYSTDFRGGWGFMINPELGVGFKI